jgi:transcriptional regulator with XRE-family HTH domain
MSGDLAQATGSDHRVRAARTAIEGAVCSRRDLARESGLSYAALRAWVTGRRRPEPASMLRLAEALDGRAERFNRLARSLRAAARR